MKYTISLCCLLSLAFSLKAVEYHVSPSGSNSYAGTSEKPFKSINHAAQLARAGDTITVHAGVYREWVNPQNGGTDNNTRILYRAAEGEKVEIKGSERITNWTREKNGSWKAIVDNAIFGDYNPYADLVYGDWFDSKKIPHHTGEVFLNDRSLYEVSSADSIANPTPIVSPRDPNGSTLVWHAEVGDRHTTIRANFGKSDPNKELTEISARRTCFYPDKPGVNFITLRGFHISQAASQWGAPTAEQIGMVATHWNKGWIIEHNTIRNAKCSGITLGKNRETGHNTWLANTAKDGSIHYIETTFNALRSGWSKDRIGSHIVRYNVISDCEQTGMCGSMGCAFSEVYGNHIYNIWVKRRFQGAEIGGIKFHAPIDTYIHHNRIHDAGRGIWLDWMTQGTRVSSNLLYRNSLEDLFLEVDHGPYIVDNNLLLSPQSLSDQTEGGAFIHNLFAGSIYSWSEFGRYTPYHLPHSTEVMGVAVIANGDHRFYNNVFALHPQRNPKSRYEPGLAIYSKAKQPIFAQSNLFLGGTQPCSPSDGTIIESFDPQITLEETADGVYLHFQGVNKAMITTPSTLIEGAQLGKPRMTILPYEFPCGNPTRFDTDYFGTPRSKTPTAGAFEEQREGENRIRVWKN